jgi:hypothetical protein
MAKQSSQNRRGREPDSSLEALKPLLVLALFGMILYGAYSVVQKGPSPAIDPAGAAADAPAFQAPDVQMVTAPPHVPVAAPVSDPLPPPLPAAPVAEAAVPAVADVAAAPSFPPPPPTVPADAAPPSDAATFLTAESAPPPVAESVAATPPPLSAAGVPPERFAAIPSDQLPPGLMAPPPADTAPLGAAAGAAAPSVFAGAWADAQGKLAAGRWAEALGTLSVWYDDPALGLEESQRLEDLLGQLAGTVIYSQQDLLLPPHVVAAGETLPAIAAPLGVSWQLLAKINGVTDPQSLRPGEQLKLVRGPFDAVISLSRRRLSLQLGGNFAGSFPVTVGRQFLDRVGGSLPVVSVQRGGPDAATVPGGPAPRAAIILGDGMAIEASDPAGFAGDAAPQASLVVAPQDLAELLDILGPGSRVLVRQ